MEKYYSDEKNVQVLIALLKEHNIRKVIASPGSANSPLTASLQNDSFFKMYSSVDERSAAYMACGLSAESGEAVVISCTGATASRNYLPGLTEAFYRKLPVLAITSTQEVSRVGHHVPQVIDRSIMPKDIANISITLPVIKDKNDFWDCEIKTNTAILALKRNGGGPAHINLSTNSIGTYETKVLPKVNLIQRINRESVFPSLGNKKIAVFVGAHKIFSKEESETIDKFCESNNAVVFCDHTSSYKGKYRVLYALAAGQQMRDSLFNKPDLIIHIGEVSGDYYSFSMIGEEVWRVSEDGEIRDTFKKLKYVFEMPEKVFFEYYSKEGSHNSNSYYKSCENHLNILRKKIPELPFSNIWIASQMAHQIPDNSTIHFGILNSLRSWNFFELPPTVTSFSNVGGFGIDGVISSLVGGAFSNTDKLHFCVVGDLAFFYDMNVLGNRHVSKNLRILLVNNGVGTEFKLYNHHTSHFGSEANSYIAAAGHFGNKSKKLVKHYAEDLGFEYLSANNKEEFIQTYKYFLTSTIKEKPIIFEVYTNSDDESESLKRMLNIEANLKEKTKQITKNILGDKGIRTIKKIIGK